LIPVDFYVVFPNEASCSRALDAVNNLLIDVWAYPYTNAFSNEHAIPWSELKFDEVSWAIKGFQRRSLSQLAEKDFNIGFYIGPFAMAEIQIEKAASIASMFETVIGYKNLPLFMAQFYACQGALYATREAIKSKSKRLGREAESWWRREQQNLKRDSPLIEILHIDYNRNKHGIGSSILYTETYDWGYVGERADVFGHEGVYKYCKSRHGRNIRRFLAQGNCTFNVKLNVADYHVAGKNVQGLSITNQINSVIDEHDRWIAEAIIKFS
jgi:hypothetical protein